MRSARPSRARRAVFALLAVMGSLALIEGLVSLALFTYDLATQAKSPIAERAHTRHDSLLGWANIPIAVSRDLYAPGRHVTINRQGFRAPVEYSHKVPPGTTRIICTGDSFTFGYAVGDEDTWCAQMQQRNPSWQMINMGQGGYGFDQAYLWYERDGRAIEHDVHLVCIGGLQIYRMPSREFYGYGKPTLALRDGRPIAQGVPISRRSFMVPWLTRNRPLLKKSRTVELATRIHARLRESTEPPGPTGHQRDALFVAACRQMLAGDRSHGSRMIVVYLPMHLERDPSRRDDWRLRALPCLAKLKIPVIDLTDDFRALDRADWRRLFIRDDDPAFAYTGAKGHYSPAGNRFVAQRIAEKLRPLVVDIHRAGVDD